MRVSLNTKDFESKIMNIAEYSLGFTEGIQKGKPIFLKRLGIATKEALAQYIDANARMNPKALHHVYEWYKTGSPQARLFNLKYSVTGVGLSIGYSFKQSSSIRSGSKEPFYNKAEIMENGIPVVISPKRNVLVFEEGGSIIFTRNNIYVDNPGGDVAGEYQKVFDDFFQNYFKQSFLRATGIMNYLENPQIFKKNLKSGSKSGKSSGIKTGYTWIVNAHIGVEDNG